jgi:hypothetical protein
MRLRPREGPGLRRRGRSSGDLIGDSPPATAPKLRRDLFGHDANGVYGHIQTF